LHRVLSAFAGHGINLTRIESRPSRRAPTQAIFFLDFLGGDSDQNVLAVLEEVRRETVSMRLLGCYPEAAPCALES
jgi:chorismate mutase/prephenate dehydratase